MSIGNKLFLTLLLACTLVVGGMLAFVHWSFERGLVELADSRQRDHIGTIADRLADVWRRDGSWEHLREDRRQWLAALAGLGERSGTGPRFGEGRARGPNWMRFAAGAPGEWPPERVMQLHGPESPHHALPLRLMLLDADGGLVYGRPELVAGSERFPITVDGRQVGSLALLPGPPIAEELEVHFLERQTAALLAIALAMIGLSAALAFPLAHRLVRPLAGFHATARRLAAGDHAARVEATGGDELGRLGRDLNALAEALERNEQARRRWVADISHELRTPLAVLRAQIEALQDGIRPLDRAAVDALHADARRLARLVDDLYQLSMTDLGALAYRKEPTEPAQILAADVDALAGRFAAAGLALRLDDRLAGPVVLQADPQRLSQLFRNLLRNSLQYTDPGGGLTVTVQRAGGALLLDFRDTAPGVPEESLPRLFERLYRVDASRSRATGGAGLGLAIARNVAEAHGGSISARAAPEGGLWVRVSLPVS